MNRSGMHSSLVCASPVVVSETAGDRKLRVGAIHHLHVPAVGENNVGERDTDDENDQVLEVADALNSLPRLEVGKELVPVRLRSCKVWHVKVLEDN